MSNLDSQLYSVFNSSTNIQRLYEIVENELDGEVNDYIEQELELNHEVVRTQSSDLLDLKGIINSQVSYLDEEIKRLQELKAWREKQKEKIEKMILYILLNFGEQDKKGIYRLDLGKYNLSTKKNPSSVEIIDSELIPVKFKKFDFTFKNLTMKDLESIKELLPGWNKHREICLKEPFETKEEGKVVKKELKVAIEEQEEKLKELNNKLSKEEITQEEYDEEYQKLPNLYAHIKEGALNLVIK